MANRKVTLVRLCKTENGWRRYPAVVGRNGRVRPNYVLVNGRQREYPEGRYQLRIYEGSRMVYRDAGDSAAEAATAQIRAEHVLAAKAEAAAGGIRIEEEAPGRVNLSRALRRFIQAAEDRGSHESALVYEFACNEFLGIVGKTYGDEITPEDLLRHKRDLRQLEKSARTIHNRHASVIAFLKYGGLDTKTLAPVRPKFEKQLPEEYSPEELIEFFASIKDERLYFIYELLLKTGLRDQEAVYLSWSNIDLKNGVLRVRSKPELGFNIKDHEERDIPIPADLLERLKVYKAKHPKIRFVTGTKTDRPNKKLLRTLKRLVNAAGLNCGQCQGCIEHNECSQWWLHKFRSTCITKLLRSGMDLRTVMKFSGHSDLESVMRYLSPARDEAIQAHVNAVKWM
jgi:integrase